MIEPKRAVQSTGKVSQPTTLTSRDFCTIGFEIIRSSDLIISSITNMYMNPHDAKALKNVRRMRVVVS